MVTLTEPLDFGWILWRLSPAPVLPTDQEVVKVVNDVVMDKLPMRKNNLVVGKVI